MSVKLGRITSLCINWKYVEWRLCIDFIKLLALELISQFLLTYIICLFTFLVNQSLFYFSNACLCGDQYTLWIILIKYWFCFAKKKSILRTNSEKTRTSANKLVSKYFRLLNCCIGLHVLAKSNVVNVGFALPLLWCRHVEITLCAYRGLV